MALPAVFDRASVHGKYVNLDGTIPTGTVTFRGGILLRAAGVDTVILPSAFTVTLSVGGEFTVLLPTTDDPDITPFDWQYEVTESFNTWTRTYYMEVPYDTVGTIEIADLEVPLGGNMAVERGRYVESIAGQVGTVTVAELGTGSASSTTFLRGDGQWAVPAGTGGTGTSDHGSLTGLTDDDHPQYHNNARGDARYLLLTARGAASGVASLDTNSRVPLTQLASGTASTTAFVRGDGAWAAPDHGAIGGLTDDDHPQYLNNTRGDLRYVLLTARGAVNGVAALDTNGRVPLTQLAAGTASTTVFLRGDGTWATPAGATGVSDHGQLSGLTDDDHPQYYNQARGDARYLLLTARAAANGVASLDSTTHVPLAQLGTGTANGTTFLRGDGTWATPTGGTGGVTDHGALTGLTDDDHTQYLNNARGDARYPLLTSVGAASGVAGLNTSARVPAVQLGSGTASATTFLRGDGTWQVPSSFGSPVGTFSFAGPLSVGVNGLRVPIIGTWVFEAISLTAGTAPAGAAVIVDVFYNGTAIYAANADRPRILSGANAGTQINAPATSTFTGTAAAPGYLTVGLAQVGSTGTEGANVVIQVYGRRTA